ncbi:MAG: cache domain-containing protein, partial [Chloroflexota bacterium]
MKAIRLGLRAKLALLFPLIAAIPLVVFGFYSLLLAKQYVAEEKPRDNLAVASTVAQLVDDHLSVLTTAIAGEAREPALAAAVVSRDESRLTPMLLSFHQAHPSFEAVFVLDRNGIALATSLADKSTVGRDFSYRDYYQGALATGQTYASEPYVGAATGKPSVGIATPLRAAASDTQGFLVGSLSLDRLSDFVGNVKLGETGHAYLVSRSGLIIAHRDKSKVLGSTRFFPSKGSGAQEVTDERGEAALVAFAPVSSLGWTVIVAQDRAEAYGHALDVVRVFAAAFVVCLAITIGLGLDLASRITSPVSALQEGTRQLARGELSHRVVVKSGDELEGLAESFNQMAESLARLDQDKLQAARRMASLLDISVATASSLDLDRILALAYEQIHRILAVSTFYVALYDGVKDELRFEIFIDKGQALEKFTRRIADGGGLTGWIVQTRKPLLIRDMQVEKPPVEAITVGEPTRSWLGLPLLFQERVVGVLSVQSYEPDAFDEADLRMLETAGNQIAMAVENSRLYAEVRQQVKELGALLKGSEAIVRVTDLNAILDVVLDQALLLVGRGQGSVLLIDRATNSLQIAASRGLPPEVEVGFNQRRVAPTAGSFGIALETGDMVEIPHARTDPRVLHEVGAIP